MNCPFKAQHSSPCCCLSVLAAVCRSGDFPGPGPRGNQGQPLPIPVPSQLQNYQRLEQNLHSARQDGSPRCVSTQARTRGVWRRRGDSSPFSVLRLASPVRRCSSGSLLGVARAGPSPPYGPGVVTACRRLSVGGARPFQLPPPGSSEACLTVLSSSLVEQLFCLRCSLIYHVFVSRLLDQFID